ncbi:hypothetical protein [Tunturiibacter gelidoferens]|uniref:Glycosyltransferase RgtA/B/C/D-like domain-containing protein n=1 Tax=Tunturiibacter lichenicola TaxID=2051959 RepID=A0A7Y9NK84_9BACT|nr:hypothetical protein [Edaphobacter lichenicola]NYF50935.1 hypothetical protein [Edaphobacter lichenicola]
MSRHKRICLIVVYVFATVQFVWCYLWLTRPYVNTLLYEEGRERMPFQGRSLMMLPMRWAHESIVLAWLARPLAKSHFWFPKPVSPEVLVQAGINVVCLLVAGYMTTRIYQASSRRRLLTPMVYPLLLVACAATYVMHTVQNFRFVYDLPSLAFFATAMYLMYFRRHWIYFAGLFVIATLNRETTLLLLPLFLLNEAVEGGRLRWSRMLRVQSLGVVVPLALFWAGWQIFLRHVFAGNVSEFYPRIDWNVKSLLFPQAWPQLMSACGYLLVFVVVMRRRIRDPRLEAWLWLLPIWFGFMFVYGILIETRVFGELIPLIVCATVLIVEEGLLAQMMMPNRQPALELAASVGTSMGAREAA